MKPYWQQDGNKIYQGHVLDLSKYLEPESVHCVVTSPPYWGLRNYGLPPMIWDADENCKHVWGDENITTSGRNDSGEKRPGFHGQSDGYGGKRKVSQGQFCQLCGAWRGSLGLEPTPELYIQHIVEIFREVKRVLRKDGTVWLNLGDSYAANRSYQVKDSIGPEDTGNEMGSKVPNGLKPKDLCEIPSDVVRALRGDGWWLRSRMPWVKRSAMPESAEDRPASALEYMFLLTKSQKYYFDMDAIKAKAIDKGIMPRNGSGKNYKRTQKEHKPDYWLTDSNRSAAGRNFRNTDLFYQSIQPPHGMIFYGDEPVGLDVNPYPQKEAHFATFPPKLVEPCILAGTSEKGCCPECGAPWERVVEKINPPRRKENRRTPPGQTKNTMPLNVNDEVPKSKTIGWKPTCNCGNEICADINNDCLLNPCTVLDIFGGSMTVAIVAHKHGRRFIMVELSETYIKDIGIPRIEKETAQMKMF